MTKSQKIEKFAVLVRRVATIFYDLENQPDIDAESIYKKIGSHNSLGKIIFYISSGDVKDIIAGIIAADSIYAEVTYNSIKIASHNSSYTETSAEPFDFIDWLSSVNTYLYKYYPNHGVDIIAPSEIGHNDAVDYGAADYNSEGVWKVVALRLLDKIDKASEIKF